jgi:hypothetical protein
VNKKASSIVFVKPYINFVTNLHTWAYGKEKIRGAERNLPDFSDCARPLPQKFFSEQINFGDLPPPSPKNFRSVYHFRGQKNFFGTIYCQYCPTFKRILHDHLYLNNKLRAFWLFSFFISHFLPDLCSIFARLFDFVIFLGGQLPPLPPRPVRLCLHKLFRDNCTNFFSRSK